MSERARDYLEVWLREITEAIGPVPPAKRLGASVRLAMQCRLGATALQIAPQEIRDAAGGDLIRRIFQALESPATAPGIEPAITAIEMLPEAEPTPLAAAAEADCV